MRAVSITGARAYHDARSPGPRAGKTARRELVNKRVGILHGCLAHRTLSDEDLGWPRAVEGFAA